ISTGGGGLPHLLRQAEDPAAERAAEDVADAFADARRRLAQQAGERTRSEFRHSGAEHIDDAALDRAQDQPGRRAETLGALDQPLDGGAPAGADLVEGLAIGLRDAVGLAPRRLGEPRLVAGNFAVVAGAEVDQLA